MRFIKFKMQLPMFRVVVSIIIISSVTLFSCSDESDNCNKNTYSNCMNDKCSQEQAIDSYNDCLYQCGEGSGCGNPCVLTCYHNDCLGLGPSSYGQCQDACDKSCK